MCQLSLGVSMVEAGDVLARIDDSLYAAAVATPGGIPDV